MCVTNDVKGRRRNESFSRHDADVMQEGEGVFAEDDEVDDAWNGAVISGAGTIPVVVQSQLFTEWTRLRIVVARLRRPCCALAVALWRCPWRKG